MEKKAAIRVQNVYSWLTTNNEDVSYTLWRALRFRAKNYFHSRLYKQKIWDGYDEFFKKESGRFLTGLLPEVEVALKHLNVKYKIIDERGDFSFRFDSIDENFLEQWNTTDKPFILHDYQADLTNQVIKHKRGVIFAPTSAGKTAIMTAILKAVPQNTPTLLLANKKQLVQQNYEELLKWGFKNAGRLYDKYTEPNIFTCATVQSLHKIEKVLPKIKVLVVDEIHDMMSKVPRKYYNKLKGAVVKVAVSATPFKFGGTDKSQKYSVKGYFGPVLKTNSSAAENGILTTKKLQEKGQLSQANCTFYYVREPVLEHEIYLDAVTRGIANNWHFHDIVVRLAKKLSGRTLILVERLSHGNDLASLIPGALWVQGKDNMETRKEVIKQLQSAKGDKIGIATQGIFNTGINVFVHNLINAAGGQADHQIVQRFGRGLRTASDKDILNYYDFIYTINQYLETHSYKRINVLEKEGHKIEIKEELDF